jgi:hypothetical protein
MWPNIGWECKWKPGRLSPLTKLNLTRFLSDGCGTTWGFVAVWNVKMRVALHKIAISACAICAPLYRQASYTTILHVRYRTSLSLTVNVIHLEYSHWQFWGLTLVKQNRSMVWHAQSCIYRCPTNTQQFPLPLANIMGNKWTEICMCGTCGRSGELDLKMETKSSIAQQDTSIDK